MEKITNPVDYAILGGGFSGLATLARIRMEKPGETVRLFEGHDRVGGWIKTNRAANFCFELGPRGIRPTPRMMKLISDLDLMSDICMAEKIASKRYVWQDNQLVQVPSFSVILELIPGILKDIFCRPGSDDNESVYDFFARHLGESIAQRWVDPIFSGIWAGDIQKLGIRDVMPTVVAVDRAHGSLVRGFLKNRRQKPQKSGPEQSPLISFKNGLETLTNRILEKYTDNIQLRSSVMAVRSHTDGFEITLENDTCIAKNVIATLPPYGLQDVVDPAWIPNNELGQVEMLSLAVVSLGYNQPVLSKSGFGYLVPSQYHSKILGCVFNSDTFNRPREAGRTNLTVMMGGAHFPTMMSEPQADLLKIAIQTVSQHLGIDVSPDVAMVEKLSRAIPNYGIGHRDRIARIRAGLPPGFHMIGNYTDGIGLSDILDSIMVLNLG